jgi:hypothetical protein
MPWKRDNLPQNSVMLHSNGSDVHAVVGPRGWVLHYLLREFRNDVSQSPTGCADSLTGSLDPSRLERLFVRGRSGLPGLVKHSFSTITFHTPPWSACSRHALDITIS